MLLVLPPCPSSTDELDTTVIIAELDHTESDQHLPSTSDGATSDLATSPNRITRGWLSLQKLGKREDFGNKLQALVDLDAVPEIAEEQENLHDSEFENIENSSKSVQSTFPEERVLRPRVRKDYWRLHHQGRADS